MPCQSAQIENVSESIIGLSPWRPASGWKFEILQRSAKFIVCGYLRKVLLQSCCQQYLRIDSH